MISNEVCVGEHSWLACLLLAYSHHELCAATITLQIAERRDGAPFDAPVLLQLLQEPLLSVTADAQVTSYLAFDIHGLVYRLHTDVHMS